MSRRDFLKGMIVAPIAVSMLATGADASLPKYGPDNARIRGRYQRWVKPIVPGLQIGDCYVFSHRSGVWIRLDGKYRKLSKEEVSHLYLMADATPGRNARWSFIHFAERAVQDSRYRFSMTSSYLRLEML